VSLNKRGCFQELRYEENAGGGGGEEWPLPRSLAEWGHILGSSQCEIGSRKEVRCLSLTVEEALLCCDGSALAHWSDFHLCLSLRK